MEAVLAQKDRLKDKADQRQAEIEENLDKVKKVNERLKALRRNVDNAVANIDSMKPVGSDSNQIKDQIEELKVSMLCRLRVHQISTFTKLISILCLSGKKFIHTISRKPNFGLS